MSSEHPPLKASWGPSRSSSSGMDRSPRSVRRLLRHSGVVPLGCLRPTQGGTSQKASETSGCCSVLAWMSRCALGEPRQGRWASYPRMQGSGVPRCESSRHAHPLVCSEGEGGGLYGSPSCVKQPACCQCRIALGADDPLARCVALVASNLKPMGGSCGTAHDPHTLPKQGDTTQQGLVCNMCHCPVAVRLHLRAIARTQSSAHNCA